MRFETYPFEKLTKLLDGIEPNSEYEASTLTIGEPQFDTPEFIQKALCQNSGYLNKYPKSAGETQLKEAMVSFVKNRFGVELNLSQLIPTFGTREVLFNFPGFLLGDKDNSVMAFTNPFYQIYEGAAIATNSKMIYLNLTKENNFTARLDKKELQEVDLVILNYPNNPTSAVISKDELIWWVDMAIKYDFVLLNDECYSEIYFDENKKPISLLEASIEANNPEFKNILVLNSISKRSSAPSLRSGFIAGDDEILKEYMLYRTYVGCASPLPLQKAATTAWSDEEHVEYFREKYRANFIVAKDILDIEIPEATFYIWLEVGDELEFTKNLYKEKNIKVIPGSFLGRDGMGKGYVRIALVEDASKTKEVLQRLKDFIDN
jgi:aspartate/methionine/tyrosine aminotransferase